MTRIPDSQWKPEDGITPEDLIWRAEQIDPTLGALFRQAAESMRLGTLRRVLRCRKHGWWCVGWIPKPS